MDGGVDQAVTVVSEKRDQTLDQLDPVLVRHPRYEIRKRVGAVVEDGLYMA
jgi:hypothetical protein